uniref:Uncharacterized protein n=1 Tax=Lactuca sativa TaxID=4236 RepID=A0A9R1XI77_LACSA|nr:hypothetical protein LSAT_V11C400177770 [Lactuca sativa]
MLRQVSFYIVRPISTWMVSVFFNPRILYNISFSLNNACKVFDENPHTKLTIITRDLYNSRKNYIFKGNINIRPFRNKENLKIEAKVKNYKGTGCYFIIVVGNTAAQKIKEKAVSIGFRNGTWMQNYVLVNVLQEERYIPNSLLCIGPRTSRGELLNCYVFLGNYIANLTLSLLKFHHWIELVLSGNLPPGYQDE